MSVNLGDVYQKGETKIEPIDLRSLPALPAGYRALNNTGYRITTTALASGPYTIRFNVSSVSNEDDFKNLKIFHVEPDRFDPDAPAWVDSTHDSTGDPERDFSSKTINSYTEELGVFVIGKLVEKIPLNTAIANLILTCSGSPDPVTSPNNVTFIVKVTNKGPQTATDVGMMDDWSPNVRLVSTTPSQGTCKEKGGNLYCKLGDLSINAAATITMVFRPNEGSASFPSDGVLLGNSAWVTSRENNRNTANNEVSAAVRALPNPNLPPHITIESPKMDSLFVGPAEITIETIAGDIDGSISKVEVLDNGRLIGTGQSLDGTHFVTTERNVSYGSHSFLAIATDNGGRQTTSNAANIIVNGAAAVRITSPIQGALIAPGSDLTLKAKATHPSGIITKVEFFAASIFLGQGVDNGANEYSLTLPKVRRATYPIIAVATDGSGITTTSHPVKITISNTPIVSIISPAERAHFLGAKSISIEAKATHPDHGDVEKVDFYANDRLIGSDRAMGTDRFVLNWRDVKEGVYFLTAVAGDDLGVTSKSAPVKVVIGNSRESERGKGGGNSFKR